ncbi:MAG: UbiA family prenyltransferase [bacterium]
MYFVHFPIFYLGLFFILVIVLCLMTRASIDRVTSVASYGLGLIVLIPFIDSFWGGFLLTYPLRIEPYFINFFNPFIDLSNIGISPGQRIITFFIVMLIAIYVYTKTRSILRTLATGFLSLMIIMLWGGLTTLLANNHPEYYFVSGGFLYSDTQKFTGIYGLLFLPIYFLFSYLYNRENLCSILGSMRLERMFLFGGMGVFGYLLAKHHASMTNANPFDPLAIALMFIILAFAFWVLQIINDFCDIKSDRLTRRRNPLLNKHIRKPYFIWGMILSLFVLIYAFMINYTAFLIMIVFLSLGFVYSIPPIRLKRIPFISTFVHALAIILAMAIGYSLIFGSRALHIIPKSLILPTLIGVTLGFSAKDINDRAADKIDHVYTLAVLFYAEDTFIHRLPLSLLIAFSYLIYAIFIPQTLPGAVLWSLLTFAVTLFSRKPKEWIYFLLLYTFGLYLLYIMTQ